MSEGRIPTKRTEKVEPVTVGAGSAPGREPRGDRFNNARAMDVISSNECDREEGAVKNQGVEGVIEKKYLVVHGKTIELVRNSDGFWQAPNGTIFAYQEDSASVDPVTRCGIGWFSLSEDNDLTDACRPHDFAYNSPVYQAFHTRLDADNKLKHDVVIIGMELKRPWYRAVGSLFRNIVRKFAGRYWENKETR